MTEHNKHPTITLDVEKYQHYLDNSDMTEEEKQEYLQTLWNILVEFIAFGFHIHPLQLIEENSGESAEMLADSLSLDELMLSSLNEKEI